MATWVWYHKRPEADADHKAKREQGVSFDRCRSCGDPIVLRDSRSCDTIDATGANDSRAKGDRG